MRDQTAESYRAALLPTGPPPEPACAKCRDTGWIEVAAKPDPEGHHCAPVFVRECACRSQPLLDGELSGRLALAGMAAGEIELAAKPWARKPYGPGVLVALDDLEAMMWTGPGFALWGPPGSGKTSAAARAAAAWVRQRRGSLAWCSVKAGLDQAVAERYDRGAEGAGRLERSWHESGLLVLDGLGEESDAGNRVHILESVLVERERRGLRTVVTSNADPRTLLDGRLVSRFRAGRVVEVVAPDFRGLRR